MHSIARSAQHRPPIVPPEFLFEDGTFSLESRDFLTVFDLLLLHRT